MLGKNILGIGVINLERVDIAIIGTGPAGISAAINAKIRHKSFLLFGTEELSPNIGKSEKIGNYPGMLSVTGRELNESFKEHLEEMEISITKERITGIYKMGDYFMLLAGQKGFEATTVIIATGAEMRKPLPGERELLGRGVSYCATCDGNLYKGKKIAVVCDNEEMEEEVSYLADLAETVYYFPLIKTTLEGENIIKMSAKIKNVQGENRVENLQLSDGSVLDIDGIFFLKATVSADILLNGLKIEEGHIAVDRNMRTSVKGCFAAGDCVGRPYQIAKSIGEGNIAAHSAISYLAELKKAAK